MLIGIDASRANRDHKTGTEWYSYYLIRHIAKLDKKNKYILYTDKPLKGGLLDLTSSENFDKSEEGEINYDEEGFQKIKSPYDNFRAKILKWPFTYFWTLGRMSLEMILYKPDILFIPSHTLPIIHPKKSVVTIHDIGYKKNRIFYSEGLIGRENSRRGKVVNFLIQIFTFGKYGANAVDYLKWSTGFALKHADKIIAISNYTKKDVEKHFQANGEKITVVYNGYDTTLYNENVDKDKVDIILDKYGIEKPYFFYIGRIERKKNIPALIEAFAILQENNPDLKHKLVLVGDASFGYDETKYAIREFDLVNKVIMPGWVQEEDIPYLFNGADAFVFPSNYEGFGIPLLQAMASGIPIAASNTTSIPEVVSGSALLFNPEYALSISDAMSRIIKDQDLRKKLIAKAKQRVKNFSWEKCAKETLDIILYNNINKLR